MKGHQRKIDVFIAVLIMLLLKQSNWIITQAVSEPKEYKLISVIEKDTTGTGKPDKVKILADEKNQGYLVEILQHDGKSYPLLGGNKRYKYLAPYTDFWKLNIRIADVNNDGKPEIITWGDMMHEDDINIFQWNGKEYAVIFYGFYWGFYFEDITGDNALELVINNRLYGTGDEYIYYQWQRDHYEKIYYKLDAGRGFDKVKDILSMLSYPGENSSAFDDPENIKYAFTDEWLSKKENIDYLRQLDSKILSVQLSEYIDEKLEWDRTISDWPVLDKWRLKVFVFPGDGTGLNKEEKTLYVETKLVPGTKGEYKIDRFEISKNVKN